MRVRSLVLTAAGALLLPLTAAPPALAEGPIVNANAAAPVKGSYLVTLKPGASGGVAPAARALAGRYSGRVGHVYSRTVQGFQALMSPERARRLAADPAVQAVEQDVKVHATDVQQNPPSWGLDRIDQKGLPLNGSYTYATKASNVTAYIVDTGILTTHSDFGGRASSGHDFVDDDNDATDCNGHGTHVAGTVGGSTYGVAKGVKLVAVRVLDCKGSGDTSGVVAGLDWVAQHAVKPAVANLSLGGGVSATLDAAIGRAVSAGVTVAVAAGNDNANACNSSPARVPAAITVGAMTKTDRRADFSNYGSCLDLFAPGDGIVSDWIGGANATRTASGTSMASPHVAGAAALVLAAHPGDTPAQVAAALTGAAGTGVGNPGASSPNRLLFTTDGGSPPPSAPCAAATSTGKVTFGAWQAASSPVEVAGCAGAAGTDGKVTVDIDVPWRGGLVIDLVAPDGTVRSLKGFDLFDFASGLKTTYTADLAGISREGTWNLRVTDFWLGSQGTVNSWTLNL
ncbi:Extracellular serine proteinase precursor [Actinomadura rubteroloni]|uniref:Extracellular serine proteinase n=1 Tax=Actinomadura rubteroloni TaxID=1926885 RepID=A0A2P4UDT7_9ACTN|nr:S8 family serine peptidase [Actinomadura rubteroloni]POM23217.1 Extracellular serine proteinase precursor [Actinomadura rubteroloni]